MRLKKTAALGVAVLTAAATGAVALGGAGAANAQAGTIPVVTVHINNGHIWLNSGTTVHAGKTIFRVVTYKGDHTLQILRLHKGYTLQQAGQDLNKAFGGDTTAVRRLDDRITWRGGAESRPTRPGRFSVSLAAGNFVFIDQDSNAVKFVTVVGTRHAQPSIPTGGSITTFSYGFGSSPARLPADGWIRVYNQSDQPHFVVLQHVKATTTWRMVHRAVKAGLNTNPSWLLKATTDSGVISPYFGEKLHVNLPAGKYLVACFWPDDDTGMPHIMMGMWKLVWLS